MGFKKRCLIAFILVIMCLCLTACGSVKIPEVSNLDEATAKNILSSNTLIPAVKYENNDEVTKGCVIKIDPQIGTPVDKNSIITIYISEGPALTVPDVTKVDETTAKNILSSNSLIPDVIYEYNDDVEKGCVIKTVPKVGDKIKPNSKVSIYISKGPAYIESTEARIQWWNVSSNADDWNFYAPYIEKDKLCIDCYVVFSAKLKWQDDQNDGRLFGIASINDIYEKSVPVSAEYTKQEWSKNEEQSFTLEIPLSDLDVDKPTSVNVSLYAYVNDVYKTISVNFTISW